MDSINNFLIQTVKDLQQTCNVFAVISSKNFNATDLAIGLPQLAKHSKM